MLAQKRIRERFLTGLRIKNGSELLLLMSFSVILSLGCNRATENDSALDRTASPGTVRPRIHVITISGFQSDPTESQIAGTSPRGFGNSGMFQLKCDLQATGFDCSFYNWNGTEAGNIADANAPGSKGIAMAMKEQAEKNANSECEFFIVAHSWGAHTMTEVADLLAGEKSVTIKSVLVVDPSSFMRGKRVENLAANIPSLINYYSANTFCWGEWKNEPRVENIPLGDPANGFCVDGHPAYGSAFNTNAHTAAEWDQKIHADIQRRITEASSRR